VVGDRETGRRRRGGNAVNPRIGSGMQQAREVEEEQSVEVAKNHAGGTRTRLVAVSRRPGSDVRPGVDSPAVRWRGVLWTTPREEARQRCWAARTGQPSGKTAPRSRGARTLIFTGERAARSADPRGPAPAGAGGQGRGGQWRRPTSHAVDRTRLSPPRARLRVVYRWREEGSRHHAGPSLKTRRTPYPASPYALGRAEKPDPSLKPLQGIHPGSHDLKGAGPDASP
jgi:hypothetical protein